MLVYSRRLSLVTWRSGNELDCGTTPGQLKNLVSLITYPQGNRSALFKYLLNLRRLQCISFVQVDLHKATTATLFNLHSLKENLLRRFVYVYLYIQ